MFSTESNMNAVKLERTPEVLQACRICLAWDCKLYNLNEWGFNHVYVELMGTTLSAWDGLPQHVCALCRALLGKAQALRARARRAEQLLKQALMHQHYVTNSFIHSIDRSMHKLAYTLSIQKAEIRFYCDHDDIYTDEPPYSNFVGLIENVPKNDIENNIENPDLKEFELNCDDDIKNDDLNEPSLDVDKFSVDQDESNVNKGDIDDVTVKSALVEAETVEKAAEKEIKTIEETKKKKRMVRKETELEKTMKVVRKKKDKRSKDKFCKEEDFKEFEKKYDFQVQCLTDEEMAKEMDKRKESNNYQKGAYKCNFCYKGFMTSSTYENHMKTHDPARGENECGLCRARFSFPVKLRQHVQSAHRLKFRCGQCGDLVRGQSAAVLHAAFHAGTTFQCAHCDKRFLKKTSRTSHMRMAHPAENAARGSCEECGETFTSRTGLKAHKTRTHKKVMRPELRCRKCRIQFDNMDALKRHKESQVDNKCDPNLSACEQCGESCAGADALVRHKHARHAQGLYTCDTCTQSFTSKSSLATHMDRVHRRIRPPKPDYSDGGRRQPDWLHWASVCEHCGKRLSCLATLKIHMNKHTGERPFKCSLCPKAYTTPNGLNNHQAFHTGVRKWQCPECPATFMHQSSVYQHRKIHTGERPHQCTICQKQFTQSGSLYTHVKYVHMKETPPPRRRSKRPAPAHN